MIDLWWKSRGDDVSGKNIVVCFPIHPGYLELYVGRCLPGPLTPGRSFSLQVYVGLTFPHVRADVPVRMTFLPLLPFGFQCFQLLISLRATMMAMITMSTTRMISRISVRPIPLSPPVDPVS